MSRPAAPHIEHRHEKERRSLVALVRRRFLGTNLPPQDEDEVVVPDCPTESSPLLSSIVGHTGAVNANDAPKAVIEEQPGKDTAPSDIHVTWPHEARIIASYAAPLVVTFLLQYSVDLSSIIAVGRIGKVYLSATCPITILTAPQAHLHPTRWRQVVLGVFSPCILTGC